MEYIGIKLLYPSVVTTVGASAPNEWFSWEVHFGLEWIGRKVKNEIAT